jgi:hypothetical protein
MALIRKLISRGRKRPKTKLQVHNAGRNIFGWFPKGGANIRAWGSMILGHTKLVLPCVYAPNLQGSVFCNLDLHNFFSFVSGGLGSIQKTVLKGFFF